MRSLVRATYRAAAAVLAGSNLERFDAVRRLNRSVMAYMRQSVVNVDGHRLHLDAYDSLNLSALRNHEVAETKVIQAILSPGDIAVDIGAHIGCHTLQMARRVGPEGHVYAFEPDPDNYSLLCRNIAENGYTNVTAENKAVSDDNKWVELYRSTIDSVDHRLFASDTSLEPLGVEAVSLDRYFDGVAPGIRLIKMDIQGNEYHAVQGMRTLLCASKDMVLMSEFWPYGLAGCGRDASGYLALLRSLGLRLYCRDDSGDGSWRPAGDALLCGRYTPANERFTTVLCSRDAHWEPRRII